jgi:hypothetical protein
VLIGCHQKRADASNAGGLGSSGAEASVVLLGRDLRFGL